MKLKIQKEQLLPSLKKVVSIVEKKNTFPVLYNILITCNSDKRTLTLTTTDLEIQVVCVINDIDCEYINSVSALTINAKKTLDIVTALPSDSAITLKTNDNNKLIISSGKSRYSMAIIDADNYPKFESTDLNNEFSINATKLRAALSKTASSMANGDIRYYLNGLMMSMTDDSVSFVSSDGHRMALCDKPIYCEDGISEVKPIPKIIIIPRKAVLELIKTLPTKKDDDSVVKVSFNSNSLCVVMNDNEIEFSTKLIDSKYPSFDRAINQPMHPRIEIERDLLSNALKRVVILANEKFKGVEINIAGYELTIKTNNPDREEASEVVDCEYNGDDISIAFNADYMIDVLSHIETDKVSIQIAENLSAIIIEGDIVDRCESDYKFVVMPMRL